MGISYNLLALIIRMVSGAVYAMILVKPIAHGLAKAGGGRAGDLAEVLLDLGLSYGTLIEFYNLVVIVD